MRYDNPGDANQCLNGCIIVYDEKPVYVYECQGRNGGGIDVQIQDLPIVGTQNIRWIDLNDPKLNYTDGLNRLGYINTPWKNAIWMVRYPARRNRQGLHNENVTIPTNQNPGLGLSSLLSYQELADAMVRKYPTLTEAYDTLRGDKTYVDRSGIKLAASKIAIHQDFAIARDKFRGDFTLEFRGEIIGWNGNEARSYILNEDFAYLKEAATELGLSVNVKAA